MKKIFYLLLTILVFSCNDTTKNKQPSKKIDSEIKKDSAEVINNSNDETEDELILGLEEFTNIEQVEFCISLPLKKYALNEDMSVSRANFFFTKNKKDKDFYIQVQGMFRADESISLDEYFKNTYASEETEEQGKIITEKNYY